MKSIIAYLLAFTMMATIATQAFLPAVAAVDAASSVSVVQVQTEPEGEGDAAASQQPDETDISSAVTSEASSQEAASSESASSEAASEETASSESVASEAASEESVSSEAASEEIASEEASSAEVVSDELLSEEEELMDQEELDEVEEPVEAAPQASVTASIHAAMLMSRDVTFIMTLYRDGEHVAQSSTTLSNNAETEAAPAQVSVEGLEAGSYQVVISAPGFADYTQSLEVGRNMRNELTLHTSELAGFENTAHPGVLRVGDANRDGALSDADADAIVDAIQNGGENVLADLDGSGEVDLGDLQLLAANLNKGDVLSTVQARLADNVAKPQVDNSTVEVKQGSLEDLVNDGASVTLENVSGAIDASNAIAVDFDFAGSDENVAPEELPQMDGMTIQTPVASDGTITDGFVTVEYVKEDGSTDSLKINISEQQSGVVALFSLFTTSARTARAADGTLEINFGKQVAVKKITLTITATQSNKLAEISKVEFLNGMENRIPEPELDIPTGLSASASDKAFLLTWKPAQNVTAYEVKITGPVKNSTGNVTATIRTNANQLLVDGLNGGKLINGKEYTVQVQSLNGEWSSGYCEPITVKPVVEKMPAAPDNLEASGGFRSISLHWKDMDDTDSYTVLYRKKSDANAEYTVAAKNITANSYKIDNLEENVEYEVTVYGTNELGDGPNAIPALAKTLSLQPAWMPSYKLINTSNGAGQLTAHIVDAVRTSDGYGGAMVNSPFAEDANSMKAWGVVDSDQSSYYRNVDWDFGVVYHAGDWGLKFTFDGVQSLGAIALAEPENGNINNVAIFYWDPTTGERKRVENVNVSLRSDENGRRHLYASFQQEVQTQQVMIGFTNSYDTRGMKLAEIRFYGYDSIYQDIMALYADDYHTTLREDVDQSVIDALYTRLNTPDPACNELHPNYTQLKRELDTAADLLANNSTLRPVQHIKAMGANVSGYADGSLGFTGLNPWQPLGVTAAAGEEITIYVGNPDLQSGTNTDLYLVATQYNAESGNFMKQIGRLKVGENTFTIPAIVSKDFERGGSLYVYYAASNKTSKYGVRVAGGTTIPMLDLYGIEDEAQRLALTQKYVEELETYVAGLEELHEQLHAGSSNANVNYEYNEEECILGATELMGDHMLFSLSAQQVLAGLGSGTTAEKAKRLNDSLLAMDQTMELFYQHKGLTETAADPINRVPSQHLNIRYMRMFAGAFMYAAGNHIGIGWGSVPGMAQGVPLQADEKGAYLAGDLFGWGIGHEIGHDINQSSYVIAEVTNNYFAQLATYGTSGVRFSYDAVYDKVTSGTIGRASDVFLQLAMYWQLRLAYDNYYPYKTFSTEQDVFNNLFFARVDTYSRTPSKAPAPGGVALKLNGGSEQNIIRLASAAAQKDLSEFFLRWGLVADEETTRYVSQFEAETRAIYYVNDSAQSYRIQNPDGQSLKDQSVLSTVDVTLTKGTGSNGLAQNQVSLTIAPASASSSLLGYEINRISISGGQENKETVGFVLAGENGAASFTDTVSTINNRAFTYQIVPVDQYLDYAQAVSMETIKINHDGSQDKSDWTVTTNMTSEQDTEVDHDEQDPDAGFDPGAHDHATVKSAIGLAFDDNLSTTYTGATQGEDAMIQVAFGKELDVTGFKFTLMSGAGQVPAGKLVLQLEENGQWVDVPVSVQSLESTGSTTVYAVNDEGWIRTSGATGLRLTFQGAQSVSITELDVLGPTGDNVEMLQDGIGILAEDYIYDQGLYEKSEHTDGFIPAGSVIFVGEYKGNPAYNAVIVYDQDGKIVGYGENGEGSAEQIILAPVPDKGDLGNTSDGRWVYWISPDAVLPEKVRVELYRVDDALTNQGQRLVSDSLWVEVPAELPQITITGDN